MPMPVGLFSSMPDPRLGRPFAAGNDRCCGGGGGGCCCCCCCCPEGSPAGQFCGWKLYSCHVKFWFGMDTKSGLFIGSPEVEPGDCRRDRLACCGPEKRLVIAGLTLAEVPLANRERLAKLSNGGFASTMLLGPPVVADAVGGIAELRSKANGPEEPSFRKWSSSNVDIGCVGYANGSSEGNMMGIKSGTLLSKPGNC